MLFPLGHFLGLRPFWGFVRLGGPAALVRLGGPAAEEDLAAVLAGGQRVARLSPAVRVQSRRLGEALPTLAGERAGPRVHLQVLFQVVSQREGGATLWTGVGPLLVVDAPDVALQVRGQAERLVADGAEVRPDAGVHLHVSAQAAGPSEGGTTLVTLELLLPRVHHLVTAQVSKRPEAFVTVRAAVRPLVGVDSEVHPEALFHGELHATFRTLEVFLLLVVPLTMHSQVLGGVESVPTVLTDVRFF